MGSMISNHLVHHLKNSINQIRDILLKEATSTAAQNPATGQNPKPKSDIVHYRDVEQYFRSLSRRIMQEKKRLGEDFDEELLPGIVQSWLQEQKWPTELSNLQALLSKGHATVSGGNIPQEPLEKMLVLALARHQLPIFRGPDDYMRTLGNVVSAALPVHGGVVTVPGSMAAGVPIENIQSGRKIRVGDLVRQVKTEDLQKIDPYVLLANEAMYHQPTSSWWDWIVENKNTLMWVGGLLALPLLFWMLSSRKRREA